MKTQSVKSIPDHKQVEPNNKETKILNLNIEAFFDFSVGHHEHVKRSD